MSEDRLAIYSYFAIHFSDMQKNEESVHPDIPYRYSGYTKSREVIPSSLSLLISRGLVKCIIKNIIYYTLLRKWEMLCMNKYLVCIRLN